MPRRGARNIRIAFTSSQLSHFGGVYLLQQFLLRLGFRTFLSHSISYPQRNNRYTLSELLIALIYPMILGLEKIEVSALLGTNGVFQYITGLPSFPDPTTLRRFLIRSAKDLLPELRAAHDNLRGQFLQSPSTPSSFWLDCDSTAHTLYGRQEGVLKGYNPAHPGKKSYHPLVVTEAHLGDCLGGVLRPGNAHTAAGVIELLSNVLRFLPHRNRIRLRADAGFYSGEFVAFLKANHIDFAIVAHLTPALKRRIAALRYERVSPLFSATSFRYQPHGWDAKERFIALRRKLPDETEGEQTTLFTLDRYAYSVIVTNLALEPYNLFNYYQQRAAMERIIRTLKEDFPFGRAPTNAFEANALYAELSLLAYNLVSWFKRLCLPDDWQSYTLPTIRHRLLMIPGELVRTSNVPTMRFPRNSPHQDIFAYALSKIQKLTPLV